MIEEMMAAARSAGLEVREASLSAGEFKAHSGLARLRGKPVLFLDPGLDPAARLDLIVTALQGFDLDNLYLSPAARERIEQNAGRRMTLP